MPYKKGVAVSNFAFTMRAIADGLPVTTGTTTGLITKDGVPAATLANASYVGNNAWNISFTAAEMDGDDILFNPVNSAALTDDWKLTTYTELDANITKVNDSDVVINDFKADVSALATSASIAALKDFDPATDIVARVTLTDTTTTNTDMRGTDGANTTAPDNAAIADTNAKVTALDVPTVAEIDTQLSSTHGAGSWETATGFSTFNPATDTVARVTLVDTVTLNSDMVDVSALATTAQLNDRTVPSAQYSTLVATDIVTGGAIATSSGVANATITEINGRTIVGNGSDEPFDVS